MRRILRTLLHGFGAREVYEAEDGASALERFRQHRREIVLVLLDLSMPVMDGEETLDALLRIDPDVRVVVTSGYDESEGIRRRGLSRAAGFLQKPYRMDDLRDVLRETLARA
ncbi:MAG: response regulator [Myxococcales bacterium]|nr:response regulator [Myxococcales bacterium]